MKETSYWQLLHEPWVYLINMFVTVVLCDIIPYKPYCDESLLKSDCLWWSISSYSDFHLASSQYLMLWTIKGTNGHSDNIWVVELYVAILVATSHIILNLPICLVTDLSRFCRNSSINLIIAFVMYYFVILVILLISMNSISWK
jgi:hypothetical protein